MKCKKLPSMILILLLIGIVSASLPNLGNFKINEEIELKQTCVINGTFCDLCNLTSIDYPNGSRIISNVEMTKRVGDFNFSLINTLTGALGRYRVNGFCDFASDVRKTFVYSFEVTRSGKNSTTGDSILYVLFSVMLFSVILILVFFSFSMPNKNDRDDRGEEMKIVKIKYIRFFLMFLIYPLIILLLNFLTGLSENFTALSMFSGIFGFLFKIMLSLAWIYTVVMIFWLIVMAIHDTNINRQIKKMQNINLFR